MSKAIIVLNEGVKLYTKEGGYFHVLLAPGSHNINAIAEGYQQQHVQVSTCLGRRSSAPLLCEALVGRLASRSLGLSAPSLWLLRCISAHYLLSSCAFHPSLHLVRLPTSCDGWKITSHHTFRVYFCGVISLHVPLSLVSMCFCPGHQRVV